MTVRRLLCMVAVLLASCAPREGVPVSEEPSAVALRPLATTVLNDVRAARASVVSLDRDRYLEHAEAGLKRLNEYYLPLLDAKEHAYQACRLYYVDPGSVGRELDEIEKLLISIITARGRSVGASMEPAFESMAGARVAMEAGSPAAPKHLQDLARRLSYMLLKGELIL